MLYQCSKSLKYFDKKCHYNQHLGRKIQCKNILDKKLDVDVKTKLGVLEQIQMIPNGIQMETKVNQNDSIIRCIICDKIYQNRSGLFKHKKSKHPNYEEDIKNINNKQEDDVLKKVKEILIDQAKQIENLNEKNKQLELLVKTSKTKNKKIINNNTTTNSNNTTNTNNGIINNINIVQFGKLNNNLSYDDPNNVIYMTLLGSSYDKLLLRSPSIKSS